MIAGKSETIVKSGTYAGRKMARFRVEDLHGRVQVTCFPRTYDEQGSQIEDGAVVVAIGRLEESGEERALILSELCSVEDAMKRFAGALVVHLTPADQELITPLQSILEQHRGPQPVYLQVLGSDGQSRRVRAGKSWQVAISAELAAGIEQLLGRGRAKLSRV